MPWCCAVGGAESRWCGVGVIAVYFLGELVVSFSCLTWCFVVCFLLSS